MESLSNKRKGNRVKAAQLLGTCLPAGHYRRFGYYHETLFQEAGNYQLSRRKARVFRKFPGYAFA